MPFPLTHLCVANRILKMKPLSNPGLFLLGAIAPDAVHHRAEFKGAGMGNIGPTKKITHLCPVSNERWGQVTDNDGWLVCIREFLQNNPPNELVLGYATHVLTDRRNNIGIWHNFRTNHPEEAAKGYTSDFYTDLRNIDIRIAKEFFVGKEIEKLLADAIPQEIHGLIYEGELRTMQQSLLDRYIPEELEQADTSNCKFVTYEETLQFIEDAAIFCVQILEEFI